VVSIGSINVFTGLAYPFLLADGFLGGLRTLGAWWLAMILAGLFPFCFLLALQGIAAWLLSYRLFLNACTVLQMVSFFGILGLFFLGPPLASPAGLVAPSNQRLLAIVPWFWFLGLFQELNGPLHPAFQALAARALGFLTGMAALAILAYATNWMRLSRQILELPDIAPADRGGPPGRIIRLLATRLLSRPLDRAVVLFTARTIARSRQHRLLLAAYAGIALAIALAYVRSLLYGESREPWNTVNVPLLVGGFVLLFFIVFGTRAAFALPIALRSNWIFRVTAVHCPSSYFAAARRALFALSVVPVCVACVIVYSIIWPFPAVLQHMLVLTLFGVLLVECSMNRFHKIPFTCSYLPGKSNLRVRLGAYAIAFLFLADLGVRIEYWAIASRSRYAVMVAVLFAAAVLASRRRVRSQDIRIQFEELTAPDVLTLELRGDRS
jgi:hypothetical protein